MKNLSMETNWNVIKETAKELGLKFVGIKKEVLVNQINAKIDEAKASKAPKTSGKWYQQENAFPYAEGEILEIINHRDNKINGRRVQVVGPSSKRNAIKVQLISVTSGDLQNTKLSMDFNEVEKVTMNYPAITGNLLPMVI